MNKDSEVSRLHRLSLIAKKHVGKSVKVSVSFLFKEGSTILSPKTSSKTHCKPEDKIRIEPSNKMEAATF